MHATLCVGSGLKRNGLAIFRRICSRRAEISIGFTRISSACRRMAESASSSSWVPAEYQRYGLRVCVSHRADDGKPIASTRHVQIREKSVKTLCSDAV